jgi:hypothetical protein
MEALDRILGKATDPTSGILHGTVFIAVERTGISSLPVDRYGKEKAERR